MISGVAIGGDGIAATCCATLLTGRQIPTNFRPNLSVARRPTLLISPQTFKLLEDVFESPLLLKDAQPIRRRVVLWGADATEPAALPHSGFAIRERQLLQILWTKTSAGVDVPIDWFIESTRPSSPRAPHNFGTRTALASTVQLTHPDNDACWVESVRDGWLFLVPTGGGEGSLIAVGNSLAVLMDQSKLVRNQVAELTGEHTEFPAYPRVFTPLCAPGWLACGTAALGFDPICGEGAGNAVREAILASAVLGSIHNGADPTPVLEQYETRLLAGFARHLQLCKQFYVSGRQNAWWDAEIEALDYGLEWTRTQLAAAPSPSGRLVGFDLVNTGNR